MFREIFVLKKTCNFRGLGPIPLSGDFKSIVGYLPATELPTYFSVFALPDVLSSFLHALKNRTNQERIERICDDIKLALCDEEEVPHLALTFAIGDLPKVKINKSSGLASIEYTFSNTLIVDGALTLFSILLLLGYENPFSESKTTKGRVLKDSKTRQKLSNFQIQVTVVFNDKARVTESQLVKFFNNYIEQNRHLHTSSIDKIDGESPLPAFVRSLARDLKFNDYGGMSLTSRSLNKSEQYITTEDIMIRVILGAVGGASVQDKTRIKENGQLPDGTVLDSKYLENIEPYLQQFFITWIDCVKGQLLRDRDGYLYSSQVWQAIGLVMHYLFQHEKTISEFEKAAKKIGQLDYSRSATHWSNCQAMRLDATGRFYINATNGGRRLKVGVANYFIKLIEN